MDILLAVLEIAVWLAVGWFIGARAILIRVRWIWAAYSVKYGLEQMGSFDDAFREMVSDVKMSHNREKMRGGK